MGKCMRTLQTSQQPASILSFNLKLHPKTSPFSVVKHKELPVICISGERVCLVVRIAPSQPYYDKLERLEL